MAMTVNLPTVECALCEKRINPPNECFRATGDFLPKGDPLNPFCNAPMHWECYAKWNKRPQFARHFVDAWVAMNRKNPFWWRVYQDEDVYVSVNPMRSVEEASVRLYALGSDIRVNLPQWGRWIEDPDAITPRLHTEEKKALSAVLPRLRERFPDDHAVVDAIDPNEKPARKAKAKAADC